MSSVVDICNEAMDLLGAATISSLTENSKEARLCNRKFSISRDTVLRAHPWNAAIARAELAADSTPPAFGFSKQFQLPTDPYCLRVLSYWNTNVNNDLAAYDSNRMFKIEGRKILSNDDACKIIYISRLTNTEDYDALLSTSIAHRLAADTAYAITGSNSVAQQMFNLYESRLKEAKGVDSMEGYPEQPVADYFIDIRF
tara:strand:+ start:112 stop:708 length:597 start_codon:yes stop_codon:yes gene_type:complete